MQSDSQMPYRNLFFFKEDVGRDVAREKSLSTGIIFSYHQSRETIPFKLQTTRRARPRRTGRRAGGQADRANKQVDS